LPVAAEQHGNQQSPSLLNEWWGLFVPVYFLTYPVKGWCLVQALMIDFYNGKYAAFDCDSCEEVVSHEDVFELINNVAIAFPMTKVDCSPGVHLIMAMCFPVESWRHDSHFQRFGMYPVAEK
jgi:hypothetical protein